MSFALSILGPLVSGVGAIATGAYQAQVARNNAKIAEQNAAYARQAGQQQAAEKSLEGAERVGAIKTAQAASGIDVNSGSAADVQAGQRAVNKLDVDTVLNNAELQAYGYTTQASSFKAQAAQDQAAGIMGGLSGALDAAKSVNWNWGSTN